MRRPLAILPIVALFLSSFVAAQTAWAQGTSATWTANAGGNWTATGNWTVPGGLYAEGQDNTATFDAGAAIGGIRTITLTTPITIGNLVFFDRDNSDANYWNITSNTLTLQTTTPAVPTITLDGTGSTTVNNWQKDARITSILAGNQGFEFYYVNGASLAARFELYGNNTYSGITDIKSGIIQTGNANALGASGTLADRTIVRSGARLHMESNTYAPEIIQLDGGTLSDPVNHSPTLKGLVYLTAPSTINKQGGGTMTFNPDSGNAIDLDSHTLTLTGNASSTTLDITVLRPIVGTGGIIKSSTGITTFGAQNTYTGVTAINGGILRVNAAENVGVSGPLGTSAASNPGSITFGGGYLQYTAANQHDYSGRFSTAAGQLYRVDLNSQDVTWATSLTSTGASSLTVAGAGLLTATPGRLELTGTNSFGSGGITVGINPSPSGDLSGSLLISAGSTSTTGALRPGVGANGRGLVRVTGTGSLIAASTDVGAGSNGALRLSAGSISAGPITSSGNGLPLIAVAGGTFTYTTLSLNAPSGFTGVFDISGGSVSGGQANIGAANARAGRVTVRGGTFTATGMSLGAINNTTGTLDISGGTLDLGTANLVLNAAGASGSGTANLIGGTVKAGGITHGGTAPANLTFSGGTLQATRSTASGFALTGMTGANIYVGGANIDTQGFDITVAQSLLGNPGQGVLTIPVATGGSGFLAPPTISITGGGGTGATAVANLSQSGVVESITVTNPGINYTGALSYTIDNTGTQGSGFTAGAATFGDNTLGGLTKKGSGKLTLSAANTYTGDTSVENGTLALLTAGTNNIASSANINLTTVNSILDVTGVSGSGGFALANGQTLGGIGTVTGDMAVASGATISPGNSPGIIDHAGNETWTAGGNYNWQILDATGIAGTGFDQIAIDGTLTIESGFDLNLWSLSSVGPDVDGDANNFNNALTQYWIVATTTGGLIDEANLALATINVAANNGTSGFTNDLGGGSFSLIQGDGVYGTTNDVVLKFTAIVSAVPEPSTFTLAALGLAGLGLVGWRRRRRN